MTGRTRRGKLEIQRTFWLPPEEWAAFQAAAPIMGTTANAEIRRALRNTVKRAEKKRQGDQ